MSSVQDKIRVFSGFPQAQVGNIQVLDQALVVQLFPNDFPKPICGPGLNSREIQNSNHSNFH